jgi:hypothetical protein
MAQPVLSHVLSGVLPLVLTGFAWGAFAAEPNPKPNTKVSSTQPEAPLSTVARVIWLDKQTNLRQALTLTTGQAQTLGPLAIRMEKCLPDINGQPNTDTAWLQISEPGRGNDWFKGWMVNTMPEIAALEHPRFDVQLVGCGTKARQRSGPVAKSGAVEVQGVDSESVNVANDPYAVPGVADTTSATVNPTEAVPAVDAEAQPATQSATEAPTPPATPTLDTEAPAPETPPTEQPKPATEGEQKDLHNMMDGGVY